MAYLIGQLRDQVTIRVVTGRLFCPTPAVEVLLCEEHTGSGLA